MGQVPVLREWHILFPISGWTRRESKDLGCRGISETPGVICWFLPDGVRSTFFLITLIFSSSPVRTISSFSRMAILSSTCFASRKKSLCSRNLLFFTFAKFRTDRPILDSISWGDTHSRELYPSASKMEMLCDSHRFFSKSGCSDFFFRQEMIHDFKVFLYASESWPSMYK